MAALKDETGGVLRLQCWAGMLPCEKLNFPPPGTQFTSQIASHAGALSLTADRNHDHSVQHKCLVFIRAHQGYKNGNPADIISCIANRRQPCFLLLLLTSNDVNTITSTWTTLQRWHYFQTMRLILRYSGGDIQIAYAARLFLICFDLDSCWAMSFLRLWCDVLRIRCRVSSCRYDAAYQWPEASIGMPTPTLS